MNSPISLKLATAILCIVLARVTPTFAVILNPNERLDYAIGRNELKLIIAGEIVEIRKEPAGPADRVIRTSPDKIDIKFAVHSVLLGNQSFAKQEITLPLTGFVWPEELVPLETGSKCILVLEDERVCSSPLCLRSVVPARATIYPPLNDGAAAKKLIAQELVEMVRTETSPNCQRLLILQAAPILSAAQARGLVPFLHGDQIWLRRAALAALAYATKDKAFIKKVENDLKQFLEQTGATDRVDDSDPMYHRPAYQFLFDHYFFLSTDWDDGEAQAGVRFLPLFRLIAQAPHIANWERWRHGISPLCRIGKKEDLRLLYKCCGKEELPSNRQEIIMAVSRILQLDLMAWPEKYFEEVARQHEKATEALIRAGIIKASEAHRHTQT